MNSPVCIEFMGIWGSGKTTLIDNLSDQLQKEDLKVVKFSDFSEYSVLRRYVYITVFLLTNPMYLINWIKFSIRIFFILKPNEKIQKNIFKTLVKIHVIKNVILKIMKPDILLWEGAYHLLPMFDKMHKLKHKDVLFSAYTTFNYSLELIVIINIDVNLAKKRVENDHLNNLCRFENNELSSLNDRYIIMVKNQKTVKSILESESKKIICIDGNNDLNKNSKHIINFLKKNQITNFNIMK